jgi:hypothetical protein
MQFRLYAVLTTVCILLTGGLANPSAESELALVARSPDADSEAIPAADFDWSETADEDLVTRSADAEAAADFDWADAADEELVTRSADAEADAFPAQLEKRACSCAKVKDPGLYCGYCYEVTSCTLKNPNKCFDKVYECSRTGSCYEYGYRGSCKRGEGPCDGRDK